MNGPSGNRLPASGCPAASTAPSGKRRHRQYHQPFSRRYGVGAGDTKGCPENVGRPNITWHMQQRLAPILFKDDDPAAGKATRPSPVAPAQRSPAALAKAATKATAGGQPVHSFATLLDNLATIAASRIQPAGGLPAFTVITTPTPLQRRALDLLGVSHRLGYA